MKRILASCAAAAAILLFGMDSSSVTGQTPSPTRERVDVSKRGPQVGERVPDFSLTDQNGRTHTLRSLTGARGLMLVFVRSADW